MSKWLAGRPLPPGCRRGKGGGRKGEEVVAMDNAAGKAQRPEERKGRDARGIDRRARERERGGRGCRGCRRERTRLFLIFKI